jgi:hypothetical protein
MVEGVDYYIDGKSGLMVLTSLFLLKRGYCCKNSCKNCPYDKIVVENEVFIDKKTTT